jgi:hypothetical protein
LDPIQLDPSGGTSIDFLSLHVMASTLQSHFRKVAANPVMFMCMKRQPARVCLT